MKSLAQWKQELRERALGKVDYGKELTDEEVEDVINEVILSEPAIQTCSVRQRQRLQKELFDSMRRLDILQMFVDDSAITEIMINGTDNIFIEKNGKLQELDMQFESREKLQDVIQQIVAGCNRAVNEASPIVDARLANGARVNIVMNPVALNGPIVTVRRFPEKPITMAELLRSRSVSEEAAVFLQALVRAKYNIFISGGTGSGKTTLLNVLSGYIPGDERVITIEDNAELQLQGLRNLVRLETRSSNVEGCREITIRDLIRASLRMRPDRIIVGEVRGAEAIDMMQALNTGHEGSMSTGHANSAEDMLFRLENMVLMGVDMPLTAVRQQLASGIDIIVHLGRLRDKSRKLLQIVEMTGYENGRFGLNVLFEFEETGEDERGILWADCAGKESCCMERSLRLRESGRKRCVRKERMRRNEEDCGEMGREETKSGGKCKKLSEHVPVRDAPKDNYVHTWTQGETMSEAIKCAGAVLMLAWFFYRSLWAVIPMSAAGVILWKMDGRKKDEADRHMLLLQFRDCIRSVEAAMQAGYSVENALRESIQDMSLMHGRDSFICRELEQIKRGLVVNITLEILLEDFGRRSGVEQIREFAEVFGIAKRSGGSIPDIIHSFSELIRRKAEAEEEIYTQTMERRMEQRIMNMMPFGIMLYLQAGNRGYFDSLYHNYSGICIMSICLAVYLAAFWLSARLTERCAQV